MNYSDMIEKAKYISRKRVGNRWVYKYPDDKKGPGRQKKQAVESKDRGGPGGVKEQTPFGWSKEFDQSKIGKQAIREGEERVAFFPDGKFQAPKTKYGHVESIAYYETMAGESYAEDHDESYFRDVRGATDIVVTGDDEGRLNIYGKVTNKNGTFFAFLGSSSTGLHMHSAMKKD